MEPICFKVPRQKEETVRVEIWDQPYFYESIHFHAECQITYIIESKGMLLVGDRLDKFKEDELYLLGTNLPHVFNNNERYFENDPKYRARAISIFFCYDTFSSMIENIPEAYGIIKLLDTSRYGIKIPAGLAQEIYPHMKLISQLKGFERVLKLLDILRIISESQDARIISTKTPFIIEENDNQKLNSVFSYIMNNFREKISLEDVSDLVCMTPTSFCRYFKQRTQKTFTGFLTEVRISNACKLLAKQGYNVSEACYSSGYNNISNFHRHFLNVVGMTPNNYRKSVLKRREIVPEKVL